MVKSKFVRFAFVFAQIVVTILGSPIVLLILLYGIIICAIRKDLDEWKTGLSFIIDVCKDAIIWIPKFLKTGDLDSFNKDVMKIEP